MKSITPCLWFNNNAEEAVAFYVSLFRDSKVAQITPYTKAGQEHHGQPVGSTMTVGFELMGQDYLALNGGPLFEFNTSCSLFVFCDSEEQCTHIWQQLSHDATTRMPLDTYAWSKRYGWVKDRFGVEWQIFFSEEGREEINPALLFTNEVYGKGASALEHYTSCFKNSKVNFVAKNEDGSAVLHAQFALEGRNFVLSEGPGEHKTAFNEAFSFIVNCDTQEEMDRHWNKLSEGGSTGPCGWLKDKFGVSWQVAPSMMKKWSSSQDLAALERVMTVVMRSAKFHIKELEEAFRSKS